MTYHYYLAKLKRAADFYKKRLSDTDEGVIRVHDKLVRELKFHENAITVIKKILIAEPPTLEEIEIFKLDAAIEKLAKFAAPDLRRLIFNKWTYADIIKHGLQPQIDFLAHGLARLKESGLRPIPGFRFFVMESLITDLTRHTEAVKTLEQISQNICPTDREVRNIEKMCRDYNKENEYWAEPLLTLFRRDLKKLSTSPRDTPHINPLNPVITQHLR